MKQKEFCFPPREAVQRHLDEMMRERAELCAVTDMRLQYSVGADPEYRPSLDRIDLNGHYPSGSLQIVCCFAKRWKGVGDDNFFLRLNCELKAAEMVS